VAIGHDDEQSPRLILDAGTGIRRVDDLLDGSPFLGSILLGHLHWDHTQGLPFFRSADRPDAVTRLLVPEQGVPAVELIRQFMSPPAFPIEPTGLRGTWSFESIDEGTHMIEDFEVKAREIPHKGGRTFGYRISDGRSSLAYLSDHGAGDTRGPGGGVPVPFDRAAIELCSGVDLLIHDAQYTVEEQITRAPFGHSSVDDAIELARRCEAGLLLLFHHDPHHTDADVGAIEAAAATTEGLEVRAAREGDVVSIGGSNRAHRN
jgi:ribonuclease BN (tRNA processing enzyme)